MSLVTDNQFLIHRLKLQHLKMEGKLAGRTMSFDSSWIEVNDYIRTYSDDFEEMKLCTSPDIIPGLPGLMLGIKYPQGRTRGDRKLSIKPEIDEDKFSNNLGLATIPEVVPKTPLETIKQTDQLIESDGDVDDDIDLDYEEFKIEAKRISQYSASPKNASGGTVPPSESGKGLPPRALLRKFSGANLQTTFQSPLNLNIQPKSRMRSRSSSSLVTPLVHRNQGTTTNSPLKFEKPCLAEPSSPGDEKPKVSLLTKMINSKKTVMDNPFLLEYGGFTGQGELQPLKLVVFIKTSQTASSKMDISVKRDATVEQVIGHCLYLYYDQRKEPPLSEEQSKVFQWTLSIAEEDGTIDDDFPAMDRARQIEKFGFDQFVLCEASPQQAKANEQAHLKIQSRQASNGNTTTSQAPIRNLISGRRTPIGPSGVVDVSKVNKPTSSNLTTPAQPASNQITSEGSTLNTPGNQFANPSNSGISSNYGGPLQLIKIQWLNSNGIQNTTTLNFSGNTRLDEVRLSVCRKWQLEPSGFQLTSSQARDALDQSATLDALLGITELTLVRKDPNLAGGLTMNMYHLDDKMLGAGSYNFYKQYVVFRRMPMFVSKQERVLAIDGFYLSLLPPDNKHGASVFNNVLGNSNSMLRVKSNFGGLSESTSTKTSSYHIGQMGTVKLSRKPRRRIKLVILRTHDTKTYDLEATTVEEAEEICRVLMKIKERWVGEGK